LNLVIVVVEVVGALLSGSVSLLSDAMHNLGDVAALFIAIFARRLARRPPSQRHTFGLRRAEVVAAVVNAATLLVLVTLVAREAIERLGTPRTLAPGTMLIVGIVGLLANLAAVLLLRPVAHASDLNLRAAFLHLVQDTLASGCVVVAALFAETRLGPTLDAAAALLIAAFVLRAGWTLLRQALHILLEGTPPGVDLTVLAQECRDRFSIEGLHHLHVWETGGGERLLTAHVLLPDQPLSTAQATLVQIHAYLAQRWHIHHATLEPEFQACEGQTLVVPHGEPRGHAHGQGLHVH
jgi:cobalt-zinc-cadmium efflux system protein